MGMRDGLNRIRTAGSGTPMEEERGATSHAAIGKHPIHPTLIPFPVAFLSATLGTDLAYRRTGDPFWARSSVWLLRAGLASGALAGVFGAIDYAKIPRVRRHSVGPLHAVGNSAVLAMALTNLMWRRDDPEEAAASRGLALSAATAALLGVTAWAGSELVYRHRVAVIEGDGEERLSEPTRGPDEKSSVEGQKPLIYEPSLR